MEQEFNIKDATLVCDDGKYFYAAKPPALYESHKHKAQMPVQKLIDDKLIDPSQKICIFSSSLVNDIKLKPKYHQ